MTMTPLPPGTHGRQSMTLIGTELAAHMAERLTAQTAEIVMQTFGISVNTWVKIRAGQPIRASVADRLLRRIQLES